MNIGRDWNKNENEGKNTAKGEITKFSTSRKRLHCVQLRETGHPLMPGFPHLDAVDGFFEGNWLKRWANLKMVSIKIYVMAEQERTWLAIDFATASITSKSTFRLQEINICSIKSVFGYRCPRLSTKHSAKVKLEYKFGLISLSVKPLLDVCVYILKHWRN